MNESIDKLYQMGSDFVAMLPTIGVAFCIFVIFLLIGRGIRSLARFIFSKKYRHRNVGLVVGRLMQGVIIFVGLLIALVIAIPGFTPGQLVSVLGISSVAIGFAFRDILQNYLAGILLLLTEPFQLGDQIKFGEYEGTVEEIQTRATMIRTYDNRRVVIPNGNLFSNAVTVNTAYEMRRLEYDIGIGYGDDIDEARRYILDAVREVDDVLKEPAPETLVVELADSSVMIRVRWWIVPPRRTDALESRDKVVEQIANILGQHGVDMPFPTQVVLFHDQTEETDGDRTRQREGWPQHPNGNPRPARLLKSNEHLN